MNTFYFNRKQERFNCLSWVLLFLFYVCGQNQTLVDNVKRWIFSSPSFFLFLCVNYNNCLGDWAFGQAVK